MSFILFFQNFHKIKFVSTIYHSYLLKLVLTSFEFFPFPQGTFSCTSGSAAAVLVNPSVINVFLAKGNCFIVVGLSLFAKGNTIFIKGILSPTIRV